MGELSPWHWAIVILIFVVLFGAKRLPDAARSLGRSARILKAELHGDAAKPAEPPAAQTPAAQTPAAQTPVAPTPVAPATVVTSDAASTPAAEAPTTAPATAGVDPVVPPAPVQEQPQTAQR